ncbi:hypothetical protein HK102_000448 [Quaeritorhiza haematococci]|nr:hypothetical protein HK102_000448 [Quaeritorhiza haematococci]
MDTTPQEIQLAPGVYFTPATKTPSAPHPPRHEDIGLLSGGTLSDDIGYLEEEIGRLKKSVELLIKSNAELREADPEDPDFREAIQENLGVIQRQLGTIKKLQNRLTELSGTSSCASGRRYTPSETPSQILGEGASAPVPPAEPSSEREPAPMDVDAVNVAQDDGRSQENETGAGIFL